MKVERTAAKDELAISGNDLEYVSRSAALINMVSTFQPCHVMTCSGRHMQFCLQYQESAMSGLMPAGVLVCIAVCGHHSYI